jgi:4-amino-4-deoxy-L-arabinose transferase-like glycosyltransferase
MPPGVSLRAPWVRDAVAIALLKVAISAVVLATGFRAVSDDDFARVVIAEQWAHAPRLDPSGTSWLPFPFWISGAALLLLGRSLEVARGAALLFGVVSALVIYVAARWITADRRSALAAAALAAAFPWSARLGVATVPELPTAAFTLLALASLVPPLGTVDPDRLSARRRLWGSLALLAATLSRYEAWPIAAAFAGFCLLCARGTALASAAGSALIALLGPAAWIAWNGHAHGDAFHFVTRVAAYRKALGGAEPGALARLTAYPMAALREEPELFALLALALCLAFVPSLAPMRERLRRFAQPAALALVQIAALCLAMVKDGAPTHHPERAVLVAFLLAALVVGDLAACFASVASPRQRCLVGIGAAVGIGLFAALIRSSLPRERFASRPEEIAVGLAGRALIPAGAKVLVEVVDHGHLAIVAAWARPEDAVLDRSIDPRDPPVRSSFEDAAALVARSAGAGASYLIGRPSKGTAGVSGEPLAQLGAFAVFRLPPRKAEAPAMGAGP